MFDLITIGGATRDFFFHYGNLKREKTPGKIEDDVLAIPYGSKLVSDHTYYDFGGGAVNVSVCNSRLGAKTAAVCSIGKEGSGSLIFNFLKKEKVNTSFVHRDNALHTGLSVLIIGADGDHTGFLERGANNHLSIQKLSPLKKTRWFYISSLTGGSAKLLPELFSFATRHKIKVAFNPGTEQLALGYHGLKHFIAGTEVLILNTEEAAELVRSKTGKMPQNNEELLAEVAELGAKITVVTEDGKGSYAVLDGKVFHERAYSEKVVDTTGAGDAFGGTFVFGMIKGFNIRYSLRIAAINAGSVVSNMGATTGLLSYNRIKSSKWL